MKEIIFRSSPVRLFISYSHADESLRNELEKHLSILKRHGVISEWHDRRIAPGSEWSREISEHLENAQVVLLLISSDFVASDYCYEIEMRRALDKHEKGETRVIPIIVRPVDWSTAPFAKLQALPRDGKPIITWNNVDEAWLDVAKGIRFICNEIFPRVFLAESNRVIDAERKDGLVATANCPEMRERVIDYLAESLHKRADPTERYWIYVALGEIGGTRAESLVTEGLSDNNEFARLGAEEAWKKLKRYSS